jgi:hypothetical protein
MCQPVGPADVVGHHDALCVGCPNTVTASPPAPRTADDSTAARATPSTAEDYLECTTALASAGAKRGASRPSRFVGVVLASAPRAPESKLGRSEPSKTWSAGHTIAVGIGLSVAELVVALVSALASLALWLNARNSHRTALEALSIERARHHAEQIPHFDVSAWEDGSGSIPRHAQLRIKLTGPAPLDEVTVSILDEIGQEHWARGRSDGLTAEQAAAFVWGDGTSRSPPRSRSPTIGQRDREPTP